MFRDYKRRSNEIKKISSDFITIGLKECGQVLLSIAKAINTKDTSYNFKRELRKFFDIFEQEYIEKNEINRQFQNESFYSVMDIVLFALRPDIRTEEKTRALIEIHPILLSFEEGLKLHKEIESMLMERELTQKQRFLSLCIPIF